MNVELRIERLVIDDAALGAAPGATHAFAAAVEAELGRLLSAGGLGPALSGGGAVPSVRGGDVPVNGATTAPADLGRSVAAAVHGGLAR